jgi:XRE family aerobic/anaerobic benzoate catabolism transcriptional regulator
MRRKAGLSRFELARRADLSARFLAEVEAGRSNISLNSLSDLCKALNVSLLYLLGSLPEAQRSVDSDPYSTIFRMISSSDAKLLEELHLWLAQRMDDRSNRIALVGLRGAGKTTIGKKVASMLRRPFVELDEVIEKAAGMALSNIFEVHGEAYYRDLENRVLTDFLRERKSAIIATGGGIVTRNDSYDLLRRHCVTFWLKAAPQHHWKRVLRQDPRPITNYPNAFSQLQNILQRREPLYALSDHTIDTSKLGVQGSARQIVEVIQTGGQGRPPSKINSGRPPYKQQLRKGKLGG